MRNIKFIAGALWLVSVPALAEVPLSGSFTASAACPALQSISRQTNPGNVALEQGATYDLVAANKTPASHVMLVIPGAEPERRWVALECGTTDRPIDQADNTKAAPPAYRGTQYVFAVNWQPAFCETAPGKTECRNQRPDSFEASNFTLHGLWPQPRSAEYCGVSERDIWASRDGRWLDLPMLDLTIAQRRDLDEVMPGSRSGLDRHEWIKHGTCYNGDQRDYIADSLDLMLALNTSEVAELFAGNIGRRITLAQVRAAFDASFGAGAGERVSLSCVEDGNRILISELQINLTGEITGPDDFVRLLLAADPTDSDCSSGQVDAVGLR
ncbi:ribonuclease T2 family protein [Devosia sediminis]|uniref:ribonuclease T2 family protein n=1 Tax=Devosia sediminis TaxID=2798801 RepID=UPI001F27818F|nr:ribonuclease [Devosia sediminis]